MDKGFHQSFKVGDKVKVRSGLIRDEKCLIGTVTGLEDSPEVYIVQNDYHYLIVGNGHLSLFQENTELVEVE